MSISGYKQISIRNIVFSWLIASAMLSPSAFSATVFGDFDAAYQLWTASSSGAIFSYNTTTNVFTATSPYHNNPLIDNNADGFPASHIAEDLNGEFSLQATIDETDTLSDGIFSLVISSPTLGITDPVTVFSGNLVSFFNLDPIHYEGFGFKGEVTSVDPTFGLTVGDINSALIPFVGAFNPCFINNGTFSPFSCAYEGGAGTAGSGPDLFISHDSLNEIPEPTSWVLLLIGICAGYNVRTRYASTQNSL